MEARGNHHSLGAQHGGWVGGSVTLCVCIANSEHSGIVSRFGNNADEEVKSKVKYRTP